MRNPVGQSLLQMTSRRRGLTLIELLVVIGVIGLMAALILPAVQGTRESARRFRCANNMRQIGVALNNHVSVHSAFPPGTDSGSISFLVPLLPFIEQSALYHALNLNPAAGTDAISNVTVTETTVSTYVCPSDWFVESQWSGSGWTNYAANVGNDQIYAVDNGLFSGQSDQGPVSIAPRDVTDGMASTAAVAEWLAGNPGDRSLAEGTFNIDSPYQSEAGYQTFLGKCSTLNPSGGTLLRVDVGADWTDSDSWSTKYNHIAAPNRFRCLSGTGYDSRDVWTAGSRHEGGLNVLFGDGHVHYVRDSIQAPVWRALGSRNGGELVEAF